jgi:hypothetical protein
MFISRSENWNLENQKPLQIEIVEGYWGDAKIEDIRCLLENVAKEILQYFDEPFSAHIFVECHPSRATPEVNCRTSSIDEQFISLTRRTIYVGLTNSHMNFVMSYPSMSICTVFRINGFTKRFANWLQFLP